LIDLSGKAVLITGGSRGIGAAAARLFARTGASVALTYNTRKQDADQVVREMGKGNREEGRGKHTAIQGDLSTAKANDRAVSQAVEALGGLDYFVANAGIWPVEAIPTTEMDDDHWRRTMATNLDAVFFGCRAALRVMREGGAIVIVASTAGQRGEPFHADYAASKGAVISYVKSLAGELGPRINVNCVAPGWVDTEMVAPALKGADQEKILSAIPLRRVASADDIAGPIVFLCSPLARHITGEVLNVNGGSVLCG
jgi:3-oxoacyl-[acyl-carrier protein] reductase